MFRPTYLFIRRVVVFVLGMSIVAVGIVMVVTPGPAIVVIPAGLAVLATEFLWARRLLQKLKDRVTAGDYFSWQKKSVRPGKGGTTGPAAEDQLKKSD
jgi:uncharacterized protein (TIGR02611 family)